MLLILIITIILAMSVGCWGSRTFNLVIENKTEYILTIYMNDYRIGEVKPSTQITKVESIDVGTYLIVAKNDNGENVFSKEYSWIELKDMKYKVVIVEPPNHS